MRKQRNDWFGMVLALGTLALLLGAPVSAEERTSGPIRIGLSGTLFPEVPDAVVGAMSRPFNRALAAETGRCGELVKVTGADNLAGQLLDNRVQLGIFTGYEFAWVRQKFPDLKPLAVAVAGPEQPQVFVIVPASSKIKCWSDLKGLAISRPRNSRPHALLFLDRQVGALGQTPKECFSQINLNADASEALDDVVEGVTQAAVVDNVTWEWYKKNKPNRTAKLRTAIASEKFPATVVAYYPGTLDQATAHSFRRGMLAAHENQTGKQLMSLWKMTGFEDVPKGYEQALKEICNAYPPPAQGPGSTNRLSEP